MEALNLSSSIILQTLKSVWLPFNDELNSIKGRERKISRKMTRKNDIANKRLKIGSDRDGKRQQKSKNTKKNEKKPKKANIPRPIYITYNIYYV